VLPPGRLGVLPRALLRTAELLCAPNTRRARARCRTTGVCNRHPMQSATVVQSAVC